jgi:hypothetical protein
MNDKLHIRIECQQGVPVVQVKQSQNPPCICGGHLISMNISPPYLTQKVSNALGF